MATVHSFYVKKKKNGKILDSIFRKIIMQTFFVFTLRNNVFGFKNVILTMPLHAAA